MVSPTPIARFAALSSALLSLSFAVPQAPAPEGDLLVVGAGIAGLSAALEAAGKGARVTVVDMWSIFGGHAVMSQGGLCIVDSPVQRARGIKDSPSLAAKDFQEWGEDANPGWVDYYVQHSREEIYDWLTGMGVTFEGVSRPPGNSVPRFHQPRGRGLGLVSPIYRECVKRQNIQFEWNLKVAGLLSEGGRVVGIRGEETRTGRTRELRAGAVLLATGGFQSNLDMVRAVWPENLPFPERLLAGSGLNSVGSGHEVAKAAGAALYHMDHQWNYSTGLPDPRYRGLDRGLNASNPASIWVNAQGKRFVNEGESTKVTFPALLAQKPAAYWAIFDEPKKRRFGVTGSDWGDFRRVDEVIFGNTELVKSAASLEGLAMAAGLPVPALVETVRRYNQMLDRGADTDFGRFGGSNGDPRTRRSADDDYVSQRIDAPPYYAVRFFPLTRKSMGGVRIDTAGRVLDRAGRPIPGLYAAGEVTGMGGINGKAGLEGTFLGPSLVTGRVAARTVVAELSRKVAPVETSASATAVPAGSSDPKDYESCRSCHNLEELLQTPRRGYSHFEKVHRVALERNYVCQQCHAELAPYDPEKHRIARLPQIENCKFCHIAEERN